MTGVAGHQGTETKITGISEHIGKNTIKIKIQSFSSTILTKNKKTTILKRQIVGKNRIPKTNIGINSLDSH